MSIGMMDISLILECEKKLSKITPPTLALFCLVGMIVLHWLVPLGGISNWALLLSGVGLMVLGILIAIAAEAQFRQAQTTVDHLGKATKLVADGWFKYSRNPMYLSFVILLTGAGLTLGSTPPLLGIIVYILLTERWYIRPEENRLTAAFGEQYKAYQMRTRRWL